MNICTAVSTWWSTPSLSSAVNNAKTIAELHAILEHGKSEDNPEPAKCTLSFWCQEQISVAGYSGCVHCLGIAEKVLQIARHTPHGLCEFPEEERPHGFVVSDLTRKCIKSSQEQYENSYKITKVFLWCTWIVSGAYIKIRYWETIDRWGIHGQYDMFHDYTEKQYIEKVGMKPPAKSASGGRREPSTSDPTRWTIPRDKQNLDKEELRKFLSSGLLTNFEKSASF